MSRVSALSRELVEEDEVPAQAEQLADEHLSASRSGRRNEKTRGSEKGEKGLGRDKRFEDDQIRCSTSEAFGVVDRGDKDVGELKLKVVWKVKAREEGRDVGFDFVHAVVKPVGSTIWQEGEASAATAVRKRVQRCGEIGMVDEHFQTDLWDVYTSKPLILLPFVSCSPQAGDIRASDDIEESEMYEQTYLEDLRTGTSSSEGFEKCVWRSREGCFG
jgi:hypothetical protein